MKRNSISNICRDDRSQHLTQALVFHEAGHAAAIYLNNRARNLPPVYFEIVFEDLSDAHVGALLSYQAPHDDAIARVEGGRLIQSLPYSLDGAPQKSMERNIALTPLDKEYETAFEADVINLLVGPLAEATHVHHRDDEVFNGRLVDLKSLYNYGGASDLALVREYLECFSENKERQDEKLHELFIEANKFIGDSSNWRAITKLAHYILESNKNTISFDEVVFVLGS